MIDARRLSTAENETDVEYLQRIQHECEMKWHHHFMAEAQLWSLMSKDPSTKVGAVAVKNRQLLATGFNGFPRGIHSVKEGEVDRATKYKYVVHAETNVIYNAADIGVSLRGACVYVTGLPPCSECAKALIQVRIAEVIFFEKNYPSQVDPSRSDWSESWKLSNSMFKEVGIKISII
jgi:dCMP deaminase